MEERLWLAVKLNAGTPPPHAKPGGNRDFPVPYGPLALHLEVVSFRSRFQPMVPGHLALFDPNAIRKSGEREPSGRSPSSCVVLSCIENTLHSAT